MTTLKQVKKSVTGHRTVDGAGVHLVRVLGVSTVQDFDPFLMLDSFDSTNPDDYIKGFPFHPHRGIETITYLIHGEMEHSDSLGNKGVIGNGESQWMTAGSGIMHQEMPVSSPRMLGVQIWLNLPKESKMTHPIYFDITKDMIPMVKTDFGEVRVISGKYENTEGVKPKNIQATLLDFNLESGKSVTIPTIPNENVFVFLIEGDAVINGDTYDEKSAVLFKNEGDAIEIHATKKKPLRFLFFEGKPLREPVAWGGPIVMNTDEELRQTFLELEEGTFIKHNAKA
ncbi:MAG: pirin family protein [Deltaproteobacteria bacterium]|jgi:redox-sensitive bicupin YhaK (pirin superfamily)|nr:pirin family protein [Deltaproteobacteria bacterium]